MEICFETYRSTYEAKFVDHQLRQQRALQQLGMIQNNAWRPPRGLLERAVFVLREWFEHFLHSCACRYQKDSDKRMLAKQTGLTRSQDKILEQQNNVESRHACSPLSKRKDPDPVATSTSNVYISGLLPSFKKNENNQESGGPFLGSKKGRKSETAEDTMLSAPRCAETSNILKVRS